MKPLSGAEMKETSLVNDKITALQNLSYHIHYEHSHHMQNVELETREEVSDP